MIKNEFSKVQKSIGIPFHELDENEAKLIIHENFDNVEIKIIEHQMPLDWEFESKAYFYYSSKKSDHSTIDLIFYNFDRSFSTIKQNHLAVFKIIELNFFKPYFEKLQIVKTSSILSKIINFEFEEPVDIEFDYCNKVQELINSILSLDTRTVLGNIMMQANFQLLLIRALEECIVEGEEKKINCQFEPKNIDHKKIEQAITILKQRIGNPITIKELSKQVAMNECYLKKGFKQIMGCTIFEFFQNERMAYAENLLCEKGLTVTEVSSLLGYSSISHFSTAFKKHTGQKPCELLLK
jgi:AraC-like DNA-binding protein